MFKPGDLIAPVSGSSWYHNGLRLAEVIEILPHDEMRISLLAWGGLFYTKYAAEFRAPLATMSYFELVLSSV